MTEHRITSPKSAGGSDIARKISSRLGERNTRFVFPTQVSADSWAEVSLAQPGTIALETDRFLGWDSFLDRITLGNIPRGRKKADASSRLLWALGLLKEQAGRPFLHTLMQPGTDPSLSLALNFARLAPALSGLAFELRTIPADRLAPERKEEFSEYLSLWVKYSRYLDEHLLYEPAHLSPSTNKSECFILFEPSLMPGYGNMAGSLENSLSIEIHSSVDSGRMGNSGTYITLLKYATFHDELQSVLAECASLLDNGLQPEDIAISFPNPSPEIQAHFRLMARQWGLPVDFRIGDSLSASPFGRLLLSLSRASAEGFSLRTLRILFDKGAFRWKDEAVAQKLIHFASRYHIPEFSADRQYMLELWRKTFSFCPDPGMEAHAFHASLVKAAHSIAGANSFATLRRALHDFKSSFLEEKDLDPVVDRTVERIFEELDALDQWHGYLGTPDLHASPLDTLLLALDATSYRHPAATNAISVYPYHVGMLVASPIHFVLDASQECLKPAIGYFSRVPEEMRGLLEENSVDEALLSSFNVVNAVYCHAERGLSGYSVPHPWFSRKGALQSVILGAQIPELPDAAESRAWRDSAANELPLSLPAARICAAQGTFASAAGVTTGTPPPTLRDKARTGNAALDPALLLALPACNAAPCFKVSPARLKSLMECPFKWLLTCIPDVEREPSSVAALAEGSLTHALIRTVLQDIALKDESFHPDRIDDYMSGLDTSFRRVLDQLLRQTGPSLAPSMEAAFPKIRDRIGRILDFETGFRIEGWEIGVFETTLSRTFADLGLSLEGRADRISRRSVGDTSAESGVEFHAIIDYKKKNTPRKRDFLVDESGMLHDFQIASYTIMLEGKGKDVERALYWSIEDSKAVTVFGPGGTRSSSREFEPERTAIYSALAAASRIIRKGAFMAIQPSLEGCSACPIRPICRAHFSSEHQ